MIPIPAPYDSYLSSWINDPGLPVVHSLIANNRFDQLHGLIDLVRIHEAFARHMPCRAPHWTGSPSLFANVKRAQFSAPAGDYGLTPLHLAVILKRHQMMPLLLETRANVNAVDGRGWSAVHHAAISHDDESLSILFTHGANRFQRNPRNGAMDDLYRMTTQPSPLNRMNVPLWNYELSRAELTPADRVFSQDMKFVTEVYTTPDDLILDWAQGQHLDSRSSSTDPRLNDNFRSAYETYLTERPLIAIARGAKNDTTGAICQIGLCTVAGQDFVRGKIVAEFGGQQMSKSLDPSDRTIYFSDYIDEGPQRLRSYGSLTADGLPNCILISAPNCRGRYRVVVMTLQRIKKGTVLRIDYGLRSPVKGEGHLEFASGVLCRFLQQHMTQVIMNNPVSFPYPLSIVKRVVCHRLQYVLHTPSTFLLALFTVRIPLWKLERLRQRAGQVAHPAVQEMLPMLHQLFANKRWWHRKKLCQQMVTLAYQGRVSSVTLLLRQCLGLTDRNLDQ